MLENTLDANKEIVTSLAPDEEEAQSVASTDETQLEEATSQEAVEDEETQEEKPEPFHLNPRFQQLVEEKNELKDEVKQLRTQVFDSVKSKEPVKDPHEGKSADEKQFWQEVRNIAKTEAEAERLKAEEKLQVVTDAYGKIAADRFLDKHGEIKKDSLELRDIVVKARAIGGNLDDAYKIVMFDKNAEDKVAEATKKKQIKTQEKMAANVETKSVSKNVTGDAAIASIEEAFKNAEKELGMS